MRISFLMILVPFFARAGYLDVCLTTDSLTQNPTNTQAAMRFETFHRVTTEASSEAQYRQPAQTYRADDQRPRQLPKEAQLRNIQSGYIFSIGDGATSRIDWRVIPSFEYLLHFGINKESQKIYSKNILNLFAVPGGKEWYKMQTSIDIRRWLMNVDYDYYQSHPLNNQGKTLEEGTEIYRLPDGSQVIMRKHLHSALIDFWAVSFRPGGL